MNEGNKRAVFLGQKEFDNTVSPEDITFYLYLADQK